MIKYRSSCALSFRCTCSPQLQRVRIGTPRTRKCGWLLLSNDQVRLYRTVHVVWLCAGSWKTMYVPMLYLYEPVRDVESPNFHDLVTPYCPVCTYTYGIHRKYRTYCTVHSCFKILNYLDRIARLGRDPRLTRIQKKTVFLNVMNHNSNAFRCIGFLRCLRWGFFRAFFLIQYLYILLSDTLDEICFLFLFFNVV